LRILKFAACSICILLLLCGCQRLKEGEIPPDDYRLGHGIYIGGVDVSKMKLADARAAIEQSAQTQLADAVFTCSLNGRSVSLQAQDLPIVIHTEEALQQAAHLSPYPGLREPARDVALRLTLDEANSAQILAHIADTFDKPAVNAVAHADRFAPGLFSYTPEQSGIAVDKNALFTQLNAAVQTGKSAAIDVPFAYVPADYTIQQAKDEHQLVASFTTSFAKSPLNASGRVFNITKAAGMIDATVLSPGEEFDINAILGKRNGENGWKQATGIRDGKYEKEYGGGVCQVSSTLFNAVMMADLEITERRPHSWPSSYVPIGRDATISTGGPNFKFVNSSDAELVVFSDVDEKQKTITVSLYGKPLPDGMRIEIDSKKTATLPALKAEVVVDKSLPSGTRVVDREGRRGQKSETYQLYYDANGNLLEKKTAFEDTYRSVRERILVSSDYNTGT